MCRQTGACRGRLHLHRNARIHAEGTQASVKTLSPEEVRGLGRPDHPGYHVYHLHLRPGEDLIREAGGLHRFMHWDGPILTDSGGFQVFSLAGLRKVREDGVSFRSHLDGSSRFLSPEVAVAIQEALGSDIMMQFDECTAWPCDEKTAAGALGRTVRWLDRCIAAKTREDQALFGIVQGAFFEELRAESARQAAARDLPGYGIGGLSVGEPKPLMNEMLDVTVPLLSENPLA